MQLGIVFLYMILPVTDVAFVKSRHETFRIAGNLCWACFSIHCTNRVSNILFQIFL